MASMEIQPLQSDIDQVIRLTAKHYGLDPKIARAQCAVESGFNPYIETKRGIGLYQLSPKIASKYRISQSRAEDWRVNIDAALRYMAELVERYQGDVAAALAVYYLGPDEGTDKTVRDLIKTHGRMWREKLGPETFRYIKEVLGDHA